MTNIEQELRNAAAAARAAALAADLELNRHLEREAAIEAKMREDAKPREPDLSNGPVHLSFVRDLRDRAYTYGAVGFRRAVGLYGRDRIECSVRWVITASRIGVAQGAKEAGRYNWNGLLEFIGEANWPTIRMMTPGDFLFGAKDAPPMVERMGDYGSVLRTDRL